MVSVRKDSTKNAGMKAEQSVVVREGQFGRTRRAERSECSSSMVVFHSEQAWRSMMTCTIISYKHELAQQRTKLMKDEDYNNIDHEGGNKIHRFPCIDNKTGQSKLLCQQLQQQVNGEQKRNIYGKIPSVPTRRNGEGVEKAPAPASGGKRRLWK